MSAEVESMFYVGRNVPWHGIGVSVEKAPSSKEALIAAGLDWEVKSHEVKDASTGLVIPGVKANVRDTDDSVLGIVGDRYKIVQNHEAFEFTDELLGNGVTYETAGSLRDGKTVWLLAKMDGVKVLGDEVTPYMCFTNSHDGTSTIKVAMVPIRVVCMNTLNIALKEAKRTWSTRHIGNINAKLAGARETLGLAVDYMEALDREADVLANVDINESKFNKIIDIMFPINDNDSERRVRNVMDARDSFIRAYNAPDINKFRNTGWGVVNAGADYLDHYSITRNTPLAQENRWSSIIGGHQFLDNLAKSVKAA